MRISELFQQFHCVHEAPKPLKRLRPPVIHQQHPTEKLGVNETLLWQLKDSNILRLTRRSQNEGYLDLLTTSLYNVARAVAA